MSEKARNAPCPICGRPAQAQFKPFCSTRCAEVDLGRWLGERYVIPGDGDEDGEDRSTRPAGSDPAGQR